MEKRNLTWYQKLKRERMRHAWTQADLAERVGSDSKTIGRWERGVSFPDPHHRQRLIEIFEKGAEELGLIDEARPYNLTLPPSEYIMKESNEANQHDSSQEDWGEAPHIETFFGRASKLAGGEQWILADRCRIVAVLGIGGVGKTTFATMLARRIKHDFHYVFWRSLRNAPSVESILKSYFQLVSSQRLAELPPDLDGQISFLIASLREHRCLLILDNVESVLQTGQLVGFYLNEYEDYGRLFQRIGEAQHQSCLILTSREKPREIVLMEGDASSVRTLSLSGIEQADGQKLLRDKHLLGSDETWAELIQLYSGNPLALKLVAEPIREVFGGDIASFLIEKEVVFGDVQDFLYQQWRRLSALEQRVMYWLAIERELVGLNAIWQDMLSSGQKGALFGALDSLRKRSLVEANGNGYFTLQPVIMEYVTSRFVRLIYKEIEAEMLDLFGSHALIKAQTNDYVRRSQVRFFLIPVAKRLLNSLGKAGSERKLKKILDMLRTIHSQKFPYAAGNILNLLIQLEANLRGYDFSYLMVQQAYLQGVALPEVNFAHADLATSVFTDTFSNILCVTVSPDGKLLAGGTTTNEVRMWRTDDMTSLFISPGHTDEIRSVAFSHDSKILASGSDDQTIRLWDARTGDCLKILQGHASIVRSVAFNSDGSVLASGSEDRTIRLWDTRTGLCLNILQGHVHWIRAIAFTPNGKVLASGSEDRTIRLWDMNTGCCLKILREHTGQVRTIMFSFDGKFLASGSEDQTIRLWNPGTGHCIKTLRGHTGRVRTLAFASNSKMLASGSDDLTIRLWDVSTGHCLKVLQEHTNRIWSLAFVPNRKLLFSASEDDTIRLWDIDAGQCLRILQGHTALIKSIAFNQDGQILASGSEDQLVRLWDTRTGECLKILPGHMNRVRSVTFSPPGTILASGSEDETIRLWETTTGRCLRILRGHTHLIRSTDFSPDGSIIASGSHDTTVRIWDANTGDSLKILRASDSLIWSVAFSPDGKFIASAGDDQTIRLWDVQTGECLKTLQGHTSWVRAVAFDPTGSIIASGSHDTTVRLWSRDTDQCFKVLRGHTNCIWSVAFSPTENIVASGSDDGTIKFWSIDTGECVKTIRSRRPYEGMNITDVRGTNNVQKSVLRILGAIDHNHDHFME